MESSERPSGQPGPEESAQSAESAGSAQSAESGTRRSDIAAETETPAETRGARFARKAHRTRLYLYAGAAVALIIFLIALVLANTDRVEVSWVFGDGSVSLVWLVLAAAVLGMLLGMILGALFHRRTRTPRR